MNYLKYEEVTLREQASQVKRIPENGIYIVRLSTKSLENEIIDVVSERLWRNPAYVAKFLSETLKKKAESYVIINELYEKILRKLQEIIEIGPETIRKYSKT